MKKFLKIFAPLFLVSSVIALPLVLTSCASTEKVWTSDDFKVDGYNLVDDPREKYPDAWKKNGLKNIDLENGIISYWCHGQDGSNTYFTEMNLVLTTNPRTTIANYDSYNYYINFHPIFGKELDQYFTMTVVDHKTKQPGFTQKTFCKPYLSAQWNWLELSFRPEMLSDNTTSIAIDGDWVTYRFDFKDPITHTIVFTKDITIKAVSER